MALLTLFRAELPDASVAFCPFDGAAAGRLAVCLDGMRRLGRAESALTISDRSISGVAAPDETTTFSDLTEHITNVHPRFASERRSPNQLINHDRGCFTLSHDNPLSPSLRRHGVSSAGAR